MPVLFERLNFSDSDRVTQAEQEHTFRARDSLFGDGFFTTGIIEDWQILNKDLHIKRLVISAEKLKFSGLDVNVIEQVVDKNINDIQRAVFRLSVTRSQAQRGYAVSANSQIVIKLLLSPWQPTSSTSFKGFFANSSLSINKQLAGIKHLNRLDNVLAASECPSVNHEAIMCIEDQVICGSRSNLFCYFDNQWVTPDLSQAGIEGITRQRILAALEQNKIPFKVGTVSREQLLSSSSAFVCNSLLGMCPLNVIENKSLDENLTLALQSQLNFNR